MLANHCHLDNDTLSGSGKRNTNGTVPGSLPYDGHSSGAWKTTSATTTTPTPTTSCAPRDGRCRCDCGGGRSQTSQRRRGRDGRTRGLCRPGSPSFSHTCPLSCFFSAHSTSHNPRNQSTAIFAVFRRVTRRRMPPAGRRPTGAADAADGGRGRLAPSRSVGRSVVR